MFSCVSVQYIFTLESIFLKWVKKHVCIGQFICSVTCCYLNIDAIFLKWIATSRYDLFSNQLDKLLEKTFSRMNWVIFYMMSMVNYLLCKLQFHATRFNSVFRIWKKQIFIWLSKLFFIPACIYSVIIWMMINILFFSTSSFLLVCKARKSDIWLTYQVWYAKDINWWGTFYK